MLLFEIAFALVHLLSCCLAADQDILTILKQQTGISTFTGFLEQLPDLVEILNQGTFSVLIPDDDAFSAFTAKNPSTTSDEEALLALLQYHIANGTHPSATFGLQPLFVPTLLSNANYTNVTGGQVVELARFNDTPTIVTGVKAESRFVEADIFFIGGLIHIVDSVLTIPISFPATITKAGLTNLVALLSKGGWLTPSSPAADIVNGLPDLTIFGPDDPRFGPTFDGFEGLSADDLLSILKYSIAQGEVYYSSKFKNNTKIMTLDEIPSTMTQTINGFFIDAAHITTTDYLTSNGVLQVIDSPLNPNATNARPAPVPVAPSESGSKGLSAAAGAGIGIAIAAIVLGGALVIALYLRTKRRRRAQGPPGLRGIHDRLDGESQERVLDRSTMMDPPPTYELDTKSINGDRDGRTTTHHVLEVHHPPKPPSPLEIDGTERSRISITITGSPPRHVGFQARFN
ncbi:uncharacterized protein A1O9_11682 [Exophiala aquamarina CBS 119918]|uniref:FAS1 domain-containing protein n=1 Tax=Exophiala aquamarina CBS 119918 TaxID=1182545 RepID=A0A072NXV7_9EURO|nr:uncharacterized protein A1O9_11682 [Exophiala aquamarina CBS 119918]KEF52441.1 hypothetical protein A1O9_11682 [Exophiala aquamarina CBS 119918]